ncbi:MAG: nucleotidyltransferase family protein [Odoribacter sp.]|nr:nucleotidyltransferase family protein [Odoribacter sp.]
MENTQQIVDRLRAYKEANADKYGIEQLGIFGSVARGEQDEKSDIDVVIKLQKPSFFTCFGIQEELRKLFRRKVDLVTLHENMFRSFRQNLEKDAIYV